MCNYQMVFKTPYACTKQMVETSWNALLRAKEVRSLICYKQEFLVQWYTSIVHTCTKDCSTNTNVCTTHLHSSLPIARHAHTQFQCANLRVLLDKRITQLN